MAKRIGIITFHRTANFGSAAQTYGLYKKITDLGYDCEVIDYRCPAIEEREKLAKTVFPPSLRKIGRAVLLQPAWNRKAAELMKFSREEMKLSIPYYPDTISDANEAYDMFIVGSDMVWARDITRSDYHYFLDFVADNRKKYAFSSSVGSTAASQDDERVGRLLSQFVRIGVREKDAVDWVRKLTHKEASWVCDPTMLLAAEDWKAFAAMKKPRKSYALVYFSDQNRKALKDAVQYAERTGKEVIYINYGLPERNVRNIKPKTIREFLSWLYYADRIFTASYHGMLFSVYFAREFMFYTRAPQARMLSLAERLGLTAYCGDCRNEADCPPVPYAPVMEKVSRFRDESVGLLESMLAESVCENTT